MSRVMVFCFLCSLNKLDIWTILSMCAQFHTHRCKCCYCFFVCVFLHYYRGADKSLARPGRKQATVTKLWLLQATQKKKFRTLSVQPGLRSSNDLRIGRKMATFQLFFQSRWAKDLSAPLYNWCFPVYVLSVIWFYCFLLWMKSNTTVSRTKVMINYKQNGRMQLFIKYMP